MFFTTNSTKVEEKSYDNLKKFRLVPKKWAGEDPWTSSRPIINQKKCLKVPKDSGEHNDFMKSHECCSLGPYRKTYFGARCRVIPFDGLMLAPIKNSSLSELWKDPPCSQWEDSRFRLRHFHPCSIANFDLTRG